MEKIARLAAVFMVLAMSQTALPTAASAKVPVSSSRSETNDKQRKEYEERKKPRPRAAKSASAPALTPAPAPAVEAVAPYIKYCAGCHGYSMRGKSVTLTRGAIDSNVGGMGSLKSLSASQLDAISNF